MTNFHFQSWCRSAVSRIVLISDRITVGRELMSHLEDRYEGYLDQGHPSGEAEKLTIQSMGSVENVARELGLIHRPFWGRTARVTRKAVIVCMCLALLFCGFYLLENYILRDTFSAPTYSRYDPYRDTYASFHAGEAYRDFYTAPEVSFSSDGYTVTLKQAACWNNVYQNAEGLWQQEDAFHIQIKISNPLVWADPDSISRWIWAEDELGNRYSAAYESGTEQPSVRVRTSRTNLWSTVHELELRNFTSQGARWIDLHYDRAGRDYTLRIDLTGGDRS